MDVMETAKEDRARDFLEASSDRTGVNGHELKYRKFCVKKKPVILRLIEHGDKLCREREWGLHPLRS